LPERPCAAVRILLGSYCSLWNKSDTQPRSAILAACARKHMFAITDLSRSLTAKALPGLAVSGLPGVSGRAVAQRCWRPTAGAWTREAGAGAP